MSNIRVLIVDDEKLARDGISLLLSKQLDITVVGECNNGEEAVASITALQPDIVFLDIQMPAMNGFEVIKALHPSVTTLIIFVTAYDKHALDAFEVNAIDYLLKPFTDERFYKALERGRSQWKKADAVNQHEKLNALLQYVQQKSDPAQAYVKKFMITEGGRIIFLPVEEIQWIEAADYYVLLHVAEKSHLIRETMNALEEKLHPDVFVRIHRSSIVNLNCIKELEPYGKEDYHVTLLNGRKLKMGRNWFKKLEKKLGRYT
jgi:two-component system LytT family response regulator